MPVTTFANLPPRIARAIELGPLDYQRKLGQSMPPAHRSPPATGGAKAAAPEVAATPPHPPTS